MFIGAVSVILILSNLFAKKSKLLYFVTFLWMWILMAGTFDIADESIYISRYTAPQSWGSSTEYLYLFIILLFNKLGMDFIHFKIAITFIELILITSTIWRFSSYPNIVLVFYFLFPFPLHIAQMRSALAAAIFIWGIRYIKEDDGKKVSIFNWEVSRNDLKYVIVILIASLVHVQSVGWLILLVAKKFSVRFTVLFTILFNIAIYFIFSPAMILRVINIFGGNNRIAHYFSIAYQTSASRQIGQLIGVLFTAVTMISLCVYILRSHRNFSNADQVRLLLKVNIVVLYILSIILRYTGEAYRVQEGIAVLNIMILTNALNRQSFKLKKISADNLILYSALIVYNIGIFAIRLLRYLVPTVLLPILENNSLLF